MTATETISAQSQDLTRLQRDRLLDLIADIDLGCEIISLGSTVDPFALNWLAFIKHELIDILGGEEVEQRIRDAVPEQTLRGQENNP